MVLSKEEFMSVLKERIGDDTSDSSLSFLENMTDTYNDLESKTQGKGEDWKSKYDELDKSWREKYTKRFFNSTADKTIEPPVDSLNDGEGENTLKSFNELFTEKGE